MSQREEPLGTGNIRMWVRTQQSDEYSKHRNAILEHGTGTGTGTKI